MIPSYLSKIYFNTVPRTYHHHAHVTCSSNATIKCGFRIWWLDFYLVAHITTCLNYSHS
jgi:hypothetical protein